MARDLPLRPTTVCGSHALPTWIFLVREATAAGRLGPTDLQEAYDDAVRLAIRDQVEAGVDVISDGEMRRITFIRGFYGRLTGIEPLPIPRRLGPPNYDTFCPYEVVGKIDAPQGLGVVDEFRFARAPADRPLRVAVPGPVTLMLPLRRGGPYGTEDALVADFAAFAAIVNRETRALAEAGCELIQIDNSFAAPRHYAPLFPQIVDAPVHQLVFEYANREMAEIELWSAHRTDKEIAVGVIDVKAFRVETAREVVARARLALEHVPAERLWLVPDCGLWETPRSVAVSKLRSMVEAACLLRRERSGRG